MKHFLFLAAAFLALKVAQANPHISVNSVSNYVGEKISVCGKVTGTKAPAINASRATSVQLADATNSAIVNVVIRQEDRKYFAYKPEEYLYNKNVCVTGVVAENNGRAEIIVRRPDEVKIEEDDGADIKPMNLEGLNRFFELED